MKRRRVKITGIGPVTSAGIGKEAFWRGILEPVSRVRPYTKFGDDFGPFVAACVADAELERQVDVASLLPKRSARHTWFALAAALLALEDAGIARDGLGGTSVAIVIGSSLLDFGGIGAGIDSVTRHGSRGALARLLLTTTLTTIPDVINRALGITARTMVLQSSCCAGMDAIGFASRLVANGEVDLALCGGTEAPLHRFPMLELRAAGLTPPNTELPERQGRPFDLWRNTGVISEGACLFVIEPEASARRGYSYLSGYAFANDAANDLCGGMATAGRLAIADAGRRPAEIEAINAWGPGHRLIDLAETRALQAIFQSSLQEIPVVSIKGAIGNALGASPAIQVATAALAQQTGVIPPTVNWDYPDPACPLKLSNRCQRIPHRTTLIDSHGVGNVNASLVLDRC